MDSRLNLAIVAFLDGVATSENLERVGRRDNQVAVVSARGLERVDSRARSERLDLVDNQGQVDTAVSLGKAPGLGRQVQAVFLGSQALARIAAIAGLAAKVERVDRVATLARAA